MNIEILLYDNLEAGLKNGFVKVKMMRESVTKDYYKHKVFWEKIKIC